MIRSFVTAAAAATAIVLAATGAGAAPGSYVPGGGQQLDPGTGQSTGVFTSDPNGRLTVQTSATGGRQFGDPEPSSGSAQANVADSFSVSAGQYRITVTYRGVATREVPRGNAAGETVADLEAYFSPAPFQGFIVGSDRTDLDTGATSLSQSVVVTFVQPGTLTVTAEIEATSWAYAEGAKASAAARTTGVRFQVQKIG